MTRKTTYNIALALWRLTNIGSTIVLLFSFSAKLNIGNPISATTPMLQRWQIV